MTTHTDLLALYKSNTGKTTHSPTSEPSLHELVGYQIPTMDKFRYQGKVE